MEERDLGDQEWVHQLYMDEVIRNDELMNSWLESRRRHDQNIEQRPQSLAPPSKEGYDPSTICRSTKIEETKQDKGTEHIASPVILPSTTITLPSAAEKHIPVDSKEDSSTTKLTWGEVIKNRVADIAKYTANCGQVACGLDDAQYGCMPRENLMQSRCDRDRYDHVATLDEQGTEILPKLNGSFSLEDSSTKVGAANSSTQLTGGQNEMKEQTMMGQKEETGKQTQGVQEKIDHDVIPILSPASGDSSDSNSTVPEKKPNTHEDHENKPLTTTLAPEIEKPLKQNSGPSSMDETKDGINQVDIPKKENLNITPRSSPLKPPTYYYEDGKWKCHMRSTQNVARQREWMVYLKEQAQGQTL